MEWLNCSRWKHSVSPLLISTPCTPHPSPLTPHTSHLHTSPLTTSHFTTHTSHPLTPSRHPTSHPHTSHLLPPPHSSSFTPHSFICHTSHPHSLSFTPHHRPQCEPAGAAWNAALPTPHWWLLCLVSVMSLVLLGDAAQVESWRNASCRGQLRRREREKEGVRE